MKVLEEGVSGTGNFRAIGSLVLNAFLAWGLLAEVLSFWNYVAFSLVLLGIYIAKSSSFAVKG